MVSTLLKAAFWLVREPRPDFGGILSPAEGSNMGIVVFELESNK
jgi:hypothetical protein